jgi:hypothetical protein
MGNGITLAMKPEITPPPYFESEFDPMLGFPNGRKERGKYIFHVFKISLFTFVYLFSDDRHRGGDDCSQITS